MGDPDVFRRYDDFIDMSPDGKWDKLTEAENTVTRAKKQLDKAQKAA